jgi:hypothetical protein
LSEIGVRRYENAAFICYAGENGLVVGLLDSMIADMHRVVAFTL